MRVYHFLETKWALDDIRRRRLKLSRQDDMNDPYELRSVRSSDPDSQLALEMTERSIADKFGALCFSGEWSSVLMWSHYADRHKGMCLGFDIPAEIAREVKYIDRIREEGAFAPSEELVNFLLEAKFTEWAYEKEVRFHGRRGQVDAETGHYFTDMDENLKLREVIAGARFPLSKAPIEEALGGYPGQVTIIKARRSESEFKIVVDESGFAPPLLFSTWV